MELNSTQSQYPLSTRKFWKKIISRGIAASLLFLLISIIATVAVMMIGSEAATDGFYISALVTGILLFIALLSLLYILPYGLYLHVYIQRYYYSLDENFITIRKGVFTPTEIHIQYQKIQDVYVDQDIFDRIFGIYDVHIASATVSSGIEAHIDGLLAVSAEGLKNEILEKIQHPGVSGPSTAQVQPSAVVAQLAEDVSTRTYPINNRWLIGTVLRTLFHLIYTVGLILLYTLFSVGDAEDTGFQVWVFVASVVIGGASSIARLGYSIWWKHNYFFEFEPEYIVLKQGVISREERHIQYSSIQNVTLKQRISDRILGICDVVIENAAVGGGGVSITPGKLGSMGVMGSNGIIIPGQLLSEGKKLVEIVNAITVQKNTFANSKGL